MEKYAREDVIIWCDDERLKDVRKGDLAAFGESASEVLELANVCNTWDIVEDIRNGSEPFWRTRNGVEKGYPFIILKKPEYIPFDFHLPEDRDAVKGKWFIDASCDFLDEVTPMGFNVDALGVGRVCLWRKDVSDVMWLTGKELMQKFRFSKSGKPIGKIV